MRDFIPFERHRRLSTPSRLTAQGTIPIVTSFYPIWRIGWVISIGKPEWWRSYEIAPISFQDTNGDRNGDLKGLECPIDYLEWLGIDAVWLTPIFPSPTLDFGYDISDCCAVDLVSAKANAKRAHLELRLGELNREIDRLVDAIAKGTVTRRCSVACLGPKGKQVARELNAELAVNDVISLQANFLGCGSLALLRFCYGLGANGDDTQKIPSELKSPRRSSMRRWSAPGSPRIRGTCTTTSTRHSTICSCASAATRSAGSCGPKGGRRRSGT